MWTWLAIISIIVCLFLVLICYVVLVVLAKRHDRKENKEKQAVSQIAKQLENIIDADTPEKRSGEMEQLRSYIKKDQRLHTDILSKMLLESMLGGSQDEVGQKALLQVLKEIKPEEHYSRLLRRGTIPEKALACKMLAAFYQEKEIPEIKKQLSSRNKELVFNAARALAVLGDEEGLRSFILTCEKKFGYSHRIIIEMFSVYSGDVKSLALNCLDECSDYMKSVILKAVARYKIKEFEPIYLMFAKHKDPNVRVASIKALCEIGDPKYEQELIIASNDNFWFVRSAAVKGLGKINTGNSHKALLKAVQDKEWWVRYNAARTLIEMDGGLELAEKVLSGYDRFAADAVKYALYKTYDTSEV